MTTGRLTLAIAGEPADSLRAVRRGEVPLGEFYERIEFLFGELRQLEDDDQYRSSPDVEAVNPFAERVHIA